MHQQNINNKQFVMSLSQIKKKYREILEQSNQSENESEDQKVISMYQQMQQRKKKILSNNKENNNSSSKKIQRFDSQKEILILRQKIAQLVFSLDKKQKLLKHQQQKRAQVLEARKLLERQIYSLKEQINRKDKQLINCQATIINYESRIKGIQKLTTESEMDKQIFNKQIEFYRLQQTKLKQLISEQQKQLKKIHKLQAKSYLHVTENQRLKDDIKRLSTLIAQEKRYKTLFKQNGELPMSFLGKPLNESEQWYSKDLIKETENFLRINQIAIGNKRFLDNLVKFVNKHIKQIEKQCAAKYKSQFKSKIKQIQRKHNHSFNFQQIEKINKLHNSNMSKSRKVSSHLSRISHSRGTISKSKKTESMMLQKSLFSHSKISLDKHTTSLSKGIPLVQTENKHYDLFQNCSQLISEFKEGMKQIMNQKQINKKKILKLTEWLLESLYELFKVRRDTLKFSLMEF